MATRGDKIFVCRDINRDRFDIARKVFFVGKASGTPL